MDIDGGCGKLKEALPVDRKHLSHLTEVHEVHVRSTPTAPSQVLLAVAYLHAHEAVSTGEWNQDSIILHQSFVRWSNVGKMLTRLDKVRSVQTRLVFRIIEPNLLFIVCPKTRDDSSFSFGCVRGLM